MVALLVSKVKWRGCLFDHKGMSEFELYVTMFSMQYIANT